MAAMGTAMQPCNNAIGGLGMAFLEVVSMQRGSMWSKGFAAGEIFFYWSSDGVISYKFRFRLPQFDIALRFAPI